MYLTENCLDQQDHFQCFACTFMLMGDYTLHFDSFHKFSYLISATLCTDITYIITDTHYNDLTSFLKHYNIIITNLNLKLNAYKIATSLFDSVLIEVV